MELCDIFTVVELHTFILLNYCDSLMFLFKHQIDESY